MAATTPQGSCEPGIGTAQREAEPSMPGSIVTAVTDKVQDMASGAKETVEDWGASAAEAADQARQKAQELASCAARKAETFGEELTALIRRYPMAALLLGFSVGFLLSQVRRR